MRRDPHDLIDAATAERLLAGDGVGPQRLVDLLSRAAGPVREGELAGEAAAVVAFRAARLVTERPARRRFPAVSALRRLVTVKAGAIALALGVAGVAVAAGTGIVPNSLPGMATAGSSPSVPTNTAYTSTTKAGEDRGVGPGHVEQTPSASPSESLNGLCTAYLAHVGADRDKLLEEPAFSRLVQAAGGTELVPAFCDALTHGASPGTDTGKGKGKSGDHPTGPPTSKPSPRAHAPVRPSQPAQ